MNVSLEKMLEDLSSEMVLKPMKDSLSDWDRASKETAISHKDIKRLSEAIMFLPVEGQNLLFGNYVFNLTESGLEKFFDITDADIKLRFFERMLSKSLNLSSDRCIDEQSMEKSCRRALVRTINKENQSEKKLVIFIGKSIAATLLVGIISFGTAMGVNAEFREAVTRWFIETMSTYSIFRFENNHIKNTEIEDYIITYVPTGFNYVGVEKDNSYISYTYEDDEGNYLSVDIEYPGENNYVDTEDTDMELLYYNGAEARYYCKDGYSMLITSIDDYALFISGPVSKEEIIKIAYGINK